VQEQQAVLPGPAPLTAIVPANQATSTHCTAAASFPSQGSCKDVGLPTPAKLPGLPGVEGGGVGEGSSGPVRWASGFKFLAPFGLGDDLLGVARAPPRSPSVVLNQGSQQNRGA